MVAVLHRTLDDRQLHPDVRQPPAQRTVRKEDNLLSALRRVIEQFEEFNAVVGNAHSQPGLQGTRQAVFDEDAEITLPFFEYSGWHHDDHRSLVLQRNGCCNRQRNKSFPHADFIGQHLARQHVKLLQDVRRRSSLTLRILQIDPA